MKKIILVALIGLSGLLGGCEKGAETAGKAVEQVAGGPADGQTIEWYKTHPIERKKEATYCMKKYGAYGYAQNIPGSPDYCGFAVSVETDAVGFYKDKIESK